MRKTIALTLLIGSRLAVAQDPTQILKDNYTLDFDNDFVRVIRVRYRPHEKLPTHDHPKTPTVYVYLTDAGPVRFKHMGPKPFELERRAVRSGGIRLSPGFVETHEVENVSDTTSEFLRVELKKVPLRQASLKGRFQPSAAPQKAKVEFDDANLRIIRIVCGVHEKCQSLASLRPAMEIALSPATVRAGTSLKDTSEISLKAGQVRWIEPHRASVLENIGAAPASLLRIEFKARPRT